MKRQPAHLHAISFVLLLLALGGCHQEQKTEQLRRWLAHTRYESMQHRALEQFTLLTTAPEFQAYSYLADETVSPFGSHRTAEQYQAVAQQHERPPQRGAPQLLENFALDAITMVGMLGRGDERRAILKVADQLYEVAPGDYLGQQFGMIEAISENAVLLQELARDADDAWIVHKTRLAMEEQER